MHFSSEDLRKLQNEYIHLNKNYMEVILEYNNLNLRNVKSSEYVFQGFLRRVKTLKRCIENVFNIHPPEKEQKPSENELEDLKINIQSFIMNCFGCIDNLAWVWVKEKNFLCSNKDVSFENKKIKPQLSPDFQQCLKESEAWLVYLTDYRHALAHRIPLYVPPFSLSSSESGKYDQLEIEKNKAFLENDLKKYKQLSTEQQNLGTFVPLIAHSFSESSQAIKFHGQLFC